jgi:hypothetical protein
MKQFAKLLVSLVLIVLAPLTSQAQGVNDAFYIYQNDGHFNGFFFDEVKEIRYSKLDTLNNEHSDYVSQEIVTANSTYRIMLSAIDSVGFVQPEIKMNTKFRDVRKEGLMNYFTYREDYTLNFVDLPASLRPKDGDVLGDFDLEEGFCLRVTSVEVNSDRTMVHCEDITDIHDIFEQFVSIEQYSADDEGNVLSRRIAGLPELTAGRVLRRDQVNFDLFSLSLSGHLPIYAGGDANASIDVNLAMAATLKAEWNFPSTYNRLVHGKKDYVGITLTLNNEVSAGFSFDGKIADVFPTGLGKFGQLPLPAAAPVFVIDFGPDGMLRGEVHGKFSLTSPKFKGKLWYQLEFDDWSPSINFGHGTPPGEPEEEEDTEENNMQVTYELSGFAQAGIQFPLKFSTNKLLEKILKCEVGTTVYLGPKITGSMSVDLQADPTPYNKYKDSKLSLSYFCADYETKAKMGAFWGSEKEVTLADGSFNLLGETEVYLLPEFQLDVTSDEHGTKFAVTPSRNLFFPVGIGFGIRHKEGYTASWFFDEPDDYMNMTARPKYWQFSSDWKKNGTAEYTFPLVNGDLTPGEWEAFPMVRILGTPLEATPVKKITVAGPVLNYKAAHIYSYPGHQGVVPLETNCTNLSIRFQNPHNDWFEVKFEKNTETQQMECKLVPKPFPGIWSRPDRFRICGDYGDTSICSDTEIEVTQLGDGEINSIRYEREGDWPFYYWAPQATTCSYSIDGLITHVQSSDTQVSGDEGKPERYTWDINFDHVRSIEESGEVRNDIRNGTFHSVYKPYIYPNSKQYYHRDDIIQHLVKGGDGNDVLVKVTSAEIDVSYNFDERLIYDDTATGFKETLKVTFENGHVETRTYNTFYFYDGQSGNMQINCVYEE